MPFFGNLRRISTKGNWERMDTQLRRESLTKHGLQLEVFDLTTLGQLIQVRSTTFGSRHQHVFLDNTTFPEAVRKFTFGI